MQPSSTTIELTEAERAALEATRAKFTPEELAEIERRQRGHEKLIARLAATETLEEQQQRADEICPRFDDWIRGRNRIQSARAPRIVAKVTARPCVVASPRERRDGSSSRTSGQDPGDDEGSGDPPRGRRLNSRAEILEWVAERDRVLSKLIEAEGLGRRQLGLDEEVAA